MGPTTCFDKSFLHSLSVDQSAWFDQYFSAVITPLFFVETLADLEKHVLAGRTPEGEVGKIAEKTPSLSGVPTVFHQTLCNGELRGYHVSMDGRPVLGDAKSAMVGEKKGFVVDLSATAEALHRWQRREFMEVERLFAKAWRAALAVPLATGASIF